MENNSRIEIHDYNQYLADFEKLTCGGTINPTDIVEYVERMKILKEHQYKIFYCRSDDRWYTTVRLPDGTRKKIKYREKKDLENYLIRFYKNDLSLQSLYSKWIELKKKEGVNNARKCVWEWNKYFEGTALAEKNMATISLGELKDDFIDICIAKEFTERQAKDAKSILNQIFDYAVERELLITNKPRKLTSLTSRKDYLRYEEAKPTSEEVFNKADAEKLINTALTMYRETRNSIYLGLIMNFQLGLRAGELIALKFNDFDTSDNVLTLHRSEIENHVVYPDGSIHRDGYRVVPYLKKYKATREIAITNDVIAIVDLIKRANEKNGFGDSEWLFIDENGEHRHSLAISKQLRALNKRADMIQRSNHKIRKTFISNLFQSGQFSLTEIRDMAGHEDGQLTLKVYGKVLTTYEEKSERMAKALSNPTLLSFENNVADFLAANS